MQMHFLHLSCPEPSYHCSLVDLQITIPAGQPKHVDPHKNRIGNCESCLKMRFLVQIPEKCENANSNAKSFKNAKKCEHFW